MTHTHIHIEHIEHIEHTRNFHSTEKNNRHSAFGGGNATIMDAIGRANG